LKFILAETVLLLLCNLFARYILHTLRQFYRMHFLPLPLASGARRGKPVGRQATCYLLVGGITCIVSRSARLADETQNTISCTYIYKVGLPLCVILITLCLANDVQSGMTANVTFYYLGHRLLSRELIASLSRANASCERWNWFSWSTLKKKDFFLNLGCYRFDSGCLNRLRLVV